MSRCGDDYISELLTCGTTTRFKIIQALLHQVELHRVAFFIHWHAVRTHFIVLTSKPLR